MSLRAVMMTVLLVPVLLLPARAATQDPAEVVRETSTQVINRLRAQKQELKADPGKLYELVNKLVAPHFDFVSMSRWVLGKNTWNSATEQQRQEFMEQFKTLLVRTYAKALLQYTDEKIKYFPAEGNPGSSLVIVKTEVQQPGGSGNIDIRYRMHEQDGVWKVVDVVVDATSLIITFRGEYSSLVQKIGLDALIERIAEKNTKIVTTSDSTGDTTVDAQAQ
jgi:phospholipid transport system substrate-binding protein